MDRITAGTPNITLISEAFGTRHTCSSSTISAGLTPGGMAIINPGGAFACCESAHRVGAERNPYHFPFELFYSLNRSITLINLIASVI